jgi:hypothetical protein
VENHFIFNISPDAAAHRANLVSNNVSADQERVTKDVQGQRFAQLKKEVAKLKDDVSKEKGVYNSQVSQGGIAVRT